MATLDRLVTETRKAFKRRARLWLTELGYQIEPPDRLLGVAPALQASYIAAAAYKRLGRRRASIMLIQYLYRDEPTADRWQSGLVTAGGSAKTSLRAAVLPLAQVSRSGLRTVVWGQVRPEAGPQRYILQQFRDGGWRAVDGVRTTTARGFLYRTLRAGKGSKLRLWYPRDRVGSPLLTVR